MFSLCTEQPQLRKGLRATFGHIWVTLLSFAVSFCLLFSNCTQCTTAIFCELKSVLHHFDVHAVCLLCTQGIYGTAAARANVSCAPSSPTVSFCVSFVACLLCDEHAQNNEKTFLHTLDIIQWSFFCLCSLPGA